MAGLDRNSIELKQVPVVVSRVSGVPDSRVDRNFDARCFAQQTAHGGCFHARSNLRERVLRDLAERV
jgi:hypothetical protein